MTVKLAASCWLLLALGATTALAQTHPRKKPVRKYAVVRRRVTESLVSLPSNEQQYCIASLRPPSVETAADFDSTYVYTYVAQMPTLNGQPAAAASIAAINQRLVVPPAAPAGRVFVKFEVNKLGYVCHPQLVKGLRADLDSAVVLATRQLPRFAPGKQNGHVVVVSLTLPVTIPAQKQP